MWLRYRVKELFSSLKWKIQRFKRGYADVDVWNFESWFLDTIPKMLTQLKKQLHGCPINMEFEDWENYLQEMINHFEVASTIDDVDDYYPEDYVYLSEAEKDLLREKSVEHIKHCKEELHKGLQMLEERFFDLWD